MTIVDRKVKDQVVTPPDIHIMVLKKICVIIVTLRFCAPSERVTLASPRSLMRDLDVWVATIARIRSSTTVF